MPTMTRAALAPTLERFVPRYPDVRLHIVEGYSGLLTDMVLADELDFAVVPTFEGRIGLKSRLLVRDREMLVSSPQRGLAPLAPVRLKDCGPLKIIVPGRSNVRRRNIEIYLQTHGVEVADMMEMDAMIGTLEFVARSDWVAILSGLICVNDIGKSERIINPLFDPPLFAEFVVISPSRRTLSTQARLFLDAFEAEIARIQEVWASVIPPAVFPETSARHRDQPAARGSAPSRSVRRHGARLLERMRARDGFVLHAGLDDPLHRRKRLEIDLEERRADRLPDQTDIGDGDLIAVAISPGGFVTREQRFERASTPRSANGGTHSSICSSLMLSVCVR